MAPFLWCFVVWFVLLNVYAIVIWFICMITGERVHFIEISDQDWCPTLFRQCIRNSLHYGWIFFGLTDYVGSPSLTLANIIAPYFKKLKCNLIIDLCSGSGGPTPNIHLILNKILNKNIKTILTDLFPQISVWKWQCSQSNNLLYSSNSVNATMVKTSKIPEISNIYKDENDKIHFRTLFGSFHHFKPYLAISILSDAMECHDAFIMAEEILRRKYIFDFIQWPLQLTLLSPFFIGYMVVNYLFFYDNMVTTFSQRILKCILIMISSPIWVTAFIHDAIISNARVYIEKELIDLTVSAKNKLKQKLSNNDQELLKRIDDYQWKCWRQNSDMIFPFNYMTQMTVLLGTPKIDDK